MGKGSSFQIPIPINRNAYTDAERAAKSLVISDLHEVVQLEDGKRLLVVEDNDELRYVMSGYLSRYFLVDQAANG